MMKEPRNLSIFKSKVDALNALGSTSCHHSKMIEGKDRRELEFLFKEERRKYRETVELNKIF